LSRKTGYWSEVCEVYQEGQSPELWRNHSDEVNVAVFARWLSADRVQRLLKTDLFDEAVGAGLYPMLASRTRIAFGIDLSLRTLRKAVSRYPKLHSVSADVRHLPFAARAFDVVVSNSTLDHFATRSEIVASLQELRRVLQARGELLLTLDNLANPIVSLRNALPFRLLSRLGIVPYYVGATLGPGRLRQLLEEIGFEVRQMEAIMHCPRFLAVALARVLRRCANSKIRRGFLGTLMAFERLSNLSTRFLTGYFVAIKAIRR
jgi:SAM-dependent methyltransferase